MGAIITLTTDFGERDGFVGAMKGVILNINSHAKLVDICHDLPSQNIQAGAVALSNACAYYPAGTIHLVVVDPGVGTRRNAMVAESEIGLFVLPDNGLLSLLEQRFPIKRAFALEVEKYRLSPVSQTFHGRDIFAPAAAHLSLGVDPQNMGSAIENPVRLSFPQFSSSKGRLTGQVFHIDVYGNLISNIRGEALRRLGSQAKLRIGSVVLHGPDLTYGHVEKGEMLFLIGSSGFVEVSLNRGNAARELGVGLGEAIEIERG